MVQTLWKAIGQFLVKLNNNLLYYLKEIKTYVQKHLCMKVHSGFSQTEK